MILNFTFLIGSSQRGPYRVDHLNPWTILGFILLKIVWFVSVGKESFNKILGPWISGPNAQTWLEANISHSKFFSKYSLKWDFFSTVIVYFSIASISPLSKGPANVLILFFLLAVSA